MTRSITAILMRNLIKLKRDKMKLFMTLFMSGLFLFIFSFISRPAVPGLEHPITYLFSGIIIMTVFQSSLNNSMSILEDISSGFMKEILVAPISRWEIAIGQVLSSTVVSVLQGLIIVVMGLFMGLHINLLHGILMIVLMFLVGVTFSAMGLYLATIAKESGNFQLLITIVAFPLTFLSGAYIPTTALPGFLVPVIYLNPLTYTTAAFRYIVLGMENMSIADVVKAGVAFNMNGFIITPLMSSMIIMAMCGLFFWLSVNRFRTADFSRIKLFKHERH